MIVFSILRIAFSALRANKLRSGLTLLGILVGVTSVMTIISALEGMMGSIENQLARLGPTTFIVSRHGGIITSEEQWREMMKRKPLDLSIKESLEESVELVDKIAVRAFSRGKVKYRSQALNRVLIGGSSASLIDIVDFEVDQGRFYSTEENFYGRNVAFVGATIQEELFPGIDPLGKEIKIDGIKYTIIGIAKKQGSTFGNNPDNFVMIPQRSFTKQFGNPDFFGGGWTYFCRAIDIEHLDEAMDEVRIVLRSHRHVPYNKPDDFSIMTAENILATLNSFTKIFRFSLIGISSISLVVGGIVVMNIMMVSVTERTREIGIRKSIGASRKHILLQFLMESLITTVGGGLVGIMLGFLIAKSLMAKIGMEIEPSMFAISAGFIVSTGIGLFFGIYPALKAAKLDPIKALSYE